MAVLMALDNPNTTKRQWVKQKKTRSSPVTTATGAHPHVAETRPQDFVSWWAWAVAQAPCMQFVPPIVIHSESGDREGWGNASVRLGDGDSMSGADVIIRGLPFTRAFEKHVWRDREDDNGRRHKLVSGVFTRGMSHLYSRRSRQTDEFRIAYAISSGESDPEHVRIVLLGSPHREYFEAATTRALEFIWDKIHIELAALPDPDAPAGAA